ncbi:hypothetical protein HAX54_000310 [Datura stramonium]|uniref:Uncharacterized protein n=1 Tax=Datura stramonium TaxID=4076 RepID=A0ABS8WTV3_DATST|nr:hypothetical protein [Datura stramonium]
MNVAPPFEYNEGSDFDDEKMTQMTRKFKRSLKRYKPSKRKSEFSMEPLPPAPSPDPEPEAPEVAIMLHDSEIKNLRDHAIARASVPEQPNPLRRRSMEFQR